MRYIANCSKELKELKRALDGAEVVIIGAGAGLSTAAGFAYSGERFEKYFAEYRQKYGFRDMYSGGFYPYPSKEEFWAYWARYIKVNRYEDPPKPVYSDLLRLVESKDYFVITTNVDHCFQKAGFDKQRLFYTQGDYGLFQCDSCKITFDNVSAIEAMTAATKDLKIPSELIPRCPKCGRYAALNLRSDDSFVEDGGWHDALARYERFLQYARGKRTLFLELGVGFNTPSIIKIPFMQMTLEDPLATYACVNLGEACCSKRIEDRAILLNCDIAYALSALLGGEM